MCDDREAEAPEGKPVLNWFPAREPTSDNLEGTVCRLEPLRPDHAPGLWDSVLVDPVQKNFNYLSYGPFDSLESYQVRNWGPHSIVWFL